MRAYHATSGAGLEGLIFREHDEPVPHRREAWVRLPDHLSFEEGATLPCAALTA